MNRDMMDAARKRAQSEASQDSERTPRLELQLPEDMAQSHTVLVHQIEDM
jgi:hypothetical protein